jgi:enoyl-CoA hydratase
MPSGLDADPDAAVAVPCTVEGGTFLRRADLRAVGTPAGNRTESTATGR